MDANDGSENGKIDWNTDDELEISDTLFSPYLNSRSDQGIIADSSKVISSSIASSSNSKVIDHFVGMGFSEKMVARAVNENGEDNEEGILEALLRYSEKTNSLLETDMTLSILLDMGYDAEEALMAMDKCGPEAELLALTDYIAAAHLEKELEAQHGKSTYDDEMDTHAQQWPSDNVFNSETKRKLHEVEKLNSKRCRGIEKNQTDDDDVLHLPNPMIGFGVPGVPSLIVERILPEEAAGRPYFYYENVACTTKGDWSKMSRFLYEIKPEFVDSKHFCAAARKRGYIHNLPINDRFPLLPIPPLKIHEALPSTKKWWPLWDERTKLNCLLTAVAPATLTEDIRCKLERYGDEPPPNIKKYIIEQCKRWNLVWVGKNRVAPLDPSEMEKLLGFPMNHTRGGGSSTTARYKALGNSFQVDTVAYHLSVLKRQFPDGITVLSLFSGIGGAEVALHRLGIRLKNVVSVEISKPNRDILRSWWEQTNQQGNLIEVADVEQVSFNRLCNWINYFGGFDLVIGGSPCNNLSGGNRVSRVGLEGKQSALFFQYFRILHDVRTIMGKS